MQSKAKKPRSPNFSAVFSRTDRRFGTKGHESRNRDGGAPGPEQVPDYGPDARKRTVRKSGRTREQQGEGPTAGGARYGVRNRNKGADTEAFRRGTERPGSGKTEGGEARFIGNLI